MSQIDEVFRIKNSGDIEEFSNMFPWIPKDIPSDMVDNL